VCSPRRFARQPPLSLGVSVRTLARAAVARACASLPPVVFRPFSLGRLGRLYGTDKIDRVHTHGGRTNCDIYESYLGRWREKKFTLLEIGVLNGASLRMWRSYFPRARVLGMDIDPAAQARVGNRFEILTGSQSDPALLDRAASADLRFVIDDGSHVNELSIATFRHLFPQLPSGAVYVLEDTLCTYEPAWRSWPGMQYIDPTVNLENRRSDIDDFLAELLHDCDVNGDERSVAFVHVWPGLIVFGRA
jgi:hypothetical protein